MTVEYPEDHVWLARVAWTRRAESPPYGGVEPIARRADGAWEELSKHEAAVTFRDKGSAFWFDLPAGLDEGDLVLVRVAPQNDPQPGKDFYHVADAWAPAYEAVDLRPWDDARSQRAALTGEGLALRLATPTVYLRLADDEAVGPVTLERQPDGRWRLDDDRADDLKVVALADDHVAPVSVGDHRAHVVLDRDALGPPTRYANWTSDRALAESLLGRLQKMDRKAGRALRFSKAEYRRYLDESPSLDLTSEHLRKQEAARFERVEELLVVVEADEALLGRAAQALLASPAIDEALEGPKREAVDAAVQAAQAELQADADRQRAELERELADRWAAADRDLADARQALAKAEDARARVQADRADAERELATLRERLDALQTQADERLASAEQALDARLAELAEKPARAFAELAVLRALLPSGAPPSAPVGAAPASTSAVEEVPPDPPPLVDSLPKAGGAVWNRLHAEDHLVGAALLAALASRRPAVVAGDGAHDALRAAADAVAGGRLTWVPVPPTVADPADLLATHAPSGRVAVHPGGLLATAERAAADGRLALVVLDGFDRAPADYYLDPLLQAHADARLGARARTVPYVGLDGHPRRLAWPPNLLLACVPSGGPSALPPGAGFWKRAVLVDVGDGPRLAEPAAPPTEVAPQAWGAALDPPPDDEPVPDLTGGTEPPPQAARSAHALYRAARAFNVSESDARALAFVGAVLPHVPDPAAGRDAIDRVVPRDAAPRALGLLETLISP